MSHEERPFRVLLVEDNPGDAVLAQEWLDREPHQFEVTHVTRVAEAIEALRTSPLDAVLLDLDLPDSSGIDSLRRVRSTSTGVPIVVLSGRDDDILRQQVLDDGAQGFIGKNDPAARIAMQSIVGAVERVRALEHHRQILGLIAANPDAVVVADAYGIVRFVNDAAVELFARPRDVFLGSQLDFACDPKGIATIEIPRADGVRSAEVRGVKVTWDGLPATLAAVRDTTEARRISEQLERSQRLEAIGRLAGGIAHDFNNLLTVILATATLLQDGKSADHEDRGDLDEILSAGQRARALTNQLLSFSRRQTIQPRIVDPAHVLLNAHKMLQRALVENIELACLPREGIWPIRVDVGQLEQVLLNLVVNARDAMPDGGRITVVVENADVAQPPDELPPGPYVRFRISDTGQGIAPEHLNKIFEPFFTTKGHGHGTGLGLATCYGILHQAGGAIAVESQLGRGTTFTLYLPAAEGAVESEPPPAHRAQKLSGTETILVVEDDPAVRRSTRRILAERGYTVHEATNGEEALRLIEAGLAVDLVVSDVIMPQMTGHELARHLSQKRGDLLLLFITGYEDQPLDEMGARAYPVLQKPFLPRDLLERVRDVLSTAQKH